AVEGLEDLDALLQADRDVLDDGVGIDLEPVLGGDALQFTAPLGDAGLEDGAVLDAEDDVLEDGEIVDQHGVQVDHAVPDRQRVAAVDIDLGLVVKGNIVTVGVVEAVENGNQGRLAGAVLADRAVDGAAPDLELDVVGGAHRAEALVDAQ